jgi:hypothetical protein
MTLTELITRAASGYPDAQILAYWDFAAERPRANRNGWDTLAYFIAVEIAETFDSEACDEDQLAEAIRAIRRAVRDLQGVIHALGEPEEEHEEVVMRVACVDWQLLESQKVEMLDAAEAENLDLSEIVKVLDLAQESANGV